MRECVADCSAICRDVLIKIEFLQGGKIMNSEEKKRGGADSSSREDRGGDSVLKPDSPCIGFCSTSFGDDWCVGCGRSAQEVIGWITYDDATKESIWKRVESEGTSYRFRK